jgi:glyoxylase-like metal-dependent hydrolase (beta-lactamase superfamily II)
VNSKPNLLEIHMSNKYRALCVIVILIVGYGATIQGQDGRTIISAAAKAMGAENLRTVELRGSGSNGGVGQNFSPAQAWPLVRAKSYTRQIDLDAMASNTQVIRFQNTAQPQNQVIPPNAPWAQQFDIWVTPDAFLKGAMDNPVTVRAETRNGVKYNVVSFLVQNRYKVEGYINEQNLVEEVRTWVDNNVLGDMLVEGLYSDYKDFGGLKVPTYVMVRQGGLPTLILIVNDAKANVPVAIPAPPAAAAAPAVRVETEQIADGVHYLKGGTHHSVLVEFADHVTLIEGPQNEARSQALLTEVQRLYPNKPLTQLINTHHHFDHSGGLRTMVDAGVTIVTHESNRLFFERAFGAPRTLNPDRLEQSKKKATILPVGEKHLLSDAARTIELHLVKDNPHNEGILLAFLPKEKIVVQVDLYTPPTPGSPAPAPNTPVNPNAAALLDNLEKLRLDFETILPLHGPGKATRADLYAFVRKPLVPISALPDPATLASRRPAPPTDAELKALVDERCSACHNLNRVHSTKSDREGWMITVTRMKDRGAAITDEQVIQLVDYLTRTHGL